MKRTAALPILLLVSLMSAQTVAPTSSLTVHHKTETHPAGST
ncbi:MAG TPA: hypothetical protein VGK02_03195 [Candidatus Aquicultor sp.]